MEDVFLALIHLYIPVDEGKMIPVDRCKIIDICSASTQKRRYRIIKGGKVRNKHVNELKDKSWFGENDGVVVYLGCPPIIFCCILVDCHVRIPVKVVELNDVVNII